ncbi:MAG: efflux RND transporter periplasmic adaptor subunit [bacterium]|nr:efflux RND transporter periplasmic adaptor subunit [bacterium]
MLLKPKRIGVAMAVITLALVAGAAVLHAGRESEANEPTDKHLLPVAVEPALLEKLSDTLRLTGEIQAIRRAQIRAETQGRVVEMPWRLGDRVAAGELLARLDGSKNRIAIRQARAMVVQAEISLEQTNDKLARSNALFEVKDLSVERRDDAVFAKRTAASNLEMRRAELESLQRAAQDFEIRAPYDAHCGEIGIQVGDYVSSGTRAFTLIAASGAKAVFKVPAERISAFAKQQSYPVSVPALDRSISAVVSAVAHDADPKSRTFKIELDLPKELSLRSGMVAKLETQLDAGRSAIVVPAEALVEKFGGSYLYLVRKGVAREIPVVIEQRRGDRVAVSGDLEAGALVVVRGQHRLTNGTRVAVSRTDASRDRNVGNGPDGVAAR